MTRSTPYILAALRILVGLFFVSSGLPKLLDPGSLVASFGHWGLPAPELFVPVIGVLEVVCGGLLALGVATRYVALPLAVIMLGAVLSAGRIDGGSHLILPPVLGLLCLLFATRGGGTWRLQLPTARSALNS